jgi:PAS domain S-box-containing protein
METGAPAGGRPLRVLVVEDDEFDRRAVRRCLQQSGVRATLDEAASAAEGLERIGRAVYDCVLLDYYIPGVEGHDLLEAIRAAAPGVPLVIFTGRGDEEIAVELMRAGAADYLPKASLTPERLAASLRHSIELAQAAAARRRAEDELRVEEARFRTLANTIPQLAWMMDPQGAWSWFNQRWLDYTGTALKAVQGEGWQGVCHPDHVQRVVEGIRRSLGTGEPWEDTYPLRGADGRYRWFLSRALPVRDDAGAVVGWFGTSTDITERLEAERAVRESEERLRRLLALEREARAEAERASRARDDVLAVVAHDLRNPIQTVLNAVAVLARPLREEDRQRHIEIVQRSVSAMDRLIGDLLDVARIEAGTLSIRRAALDLRAVVDEALEPFAATALARRIKLGFESEPDLPPVTADHDRLVQVLSNVIANALKFTPDGGLVSVRARRADGAVQISVEDSGPGLPAADLPRVFDRFWQGDRAARRGAGLGLAICKGIVEAHGGRIWAESPPGQGATFHVSLPDGQA